MHLNLWKGARVALLAGVAGAALSGCGQAPDPAIRPTSAAPSVATSDAPPVTVPTGRVTATFSALPNPCTWISESEVSGYVGAPARVTGEAEADGGRNCSFGYPADSPTAVLTITVWQGRQHYTPDSNPADFQAVPGIGDAAHAGQYFIFRKGDTVLRVALTGSDPDRPTKEKRIAQLIVSRLP
jgi:hypothetical protein